MARIRSFLELADYYRRSSNISEELPPLFMQISLDRKLSRIEEMTEAFKTLKEKLSFQSVQSFHDFDKTFIVETDAPSVDVGRQWPKGKKMTR